MRNKLIRGLLGIAMAGALAFGGGVAGMATSSAIEVEAATLPGDYRNVTTSAITDVSQYRVGDWIIYEFDNCTDLTDMFIYHITKIEEDRVWYDYYYEDEYIDEDWYEIDREQNYIERYGCQRISWGTLSAWSPVQSLNISGKAFTSWEEIAGLLPGITKESINDNYLKISVDPITENAIQAKAVLAMDESDIDGIHVFIGGGNAITFKNSNDYSQYVSMSFTHKDTATDDSLTIDFNNKQNIGGNVVLHSVIAADKAYKVYKVTDAGEVLVAGGRSTDEGRVCFNITETAKYVIRY